MALIWGDGREICCSTEESAIPQFPPVVVCRDCGCAFGMTQEDCSPDFSQLKKKGFKLEISEPNDQNVTYFAFMTNKSRPLDCPPGCIPAKVPCCCPCCRSKERSSCHFRNCTCYLCHKKRDSCLNFYRREVLARQKSLRLTNSAFPIFGKLADEDEDFVPRNRSHLCTCHRQVPTTWFVKDPCPVRNDRTLLIGYKHGQRQTNTESLKIIQHAVYLEPDPVKKILTPSLSQQEWPITSNFCEIITHSHYSPRPANKKTEAKSSTGNQIRKKGWQS